jgi:hypothetical protein
VEELEEDDDWSQFVFSSLLLGEVASSLDKRLFLLAAVEQDVVVEGASFPCETKVSLRRRFWNQI